MINFQLAEDTVGYQTVTDPTKTDKRLLIAGSQNVLIDQQAKVRSRPGYTRLGAANTALTPILNSWKWDSSTGQKLSQRNYNGILEVYLGTVDGTAINAWTQVSAAFSTTKKIRPALGQVNSGGGIYDPGEAIDLQIMVNGDTNLYEWGGGVAVVASASAAGQTVTKGGTSTFGQNRFYASRNQIFICVRTGTEYAYTGGLSSLTLTGVTTSGSFDLQAGDILIQKIVTQSNKPNSTRLNDVIFSFQNQIAVGSKTDNQIYISKNSAGSLSYNDFSYSTPRVAGEGGLLTLDGPCRAINALGEYLLAFAGLSSIFRANYQQITVSTTLAETLAVKKFDVGINQGALNHECVIPIGNQLAYLTNEVALRTIDNVQNLTGIDPRRLSTPVKPDFDAETWNEDNSFGIWYKNTLFFSAGATSHTYMLNYAENAQGKTVRFWNPPQLLPVGAFSVIDSGNGPLLHGHSNAVPETYLLFDGLSDGQYANMDVGDKIPIHAIAKYAYNIFGEREKLKTFDEYAVDGEINPNTQDLILGLNYDLDGSTQQVQKTIDGTDEGILQGLVNNNSLAQSLLAAQPLGGLLVPPGDARRFHVVFEIAKEDFFELSATFETDDVDRYWAILAHGPNAQLSAHRATTIRR